MSIQVLKVPDGADDLLLERTPMRLLTLLSLPVVTCGLALAAQGPEGFTYVDGNVTELTANTGGTVSFASDKAVELKTGSNKVEIPYASISKAELGITKVHSP